MRTAAILVTVLALAAAAYALWPRDSSTQSDACGATDAHPAQTGAAAAGAATVCLLNRERTTRGLPALRENGLLAAASLEHSEDMVRRRYFEHTAPDGRDVQTRLRAIGYSRGVSASTGENIAYGYGAKSTPAAIVRTWMNSPPHRADILRPAFREIGIGIATGAPALPDAKQADSATYTTDFGGVLDPSLESG